MDTNELSVYERRKNKTLPEVIGAMFMNNPEIPDMMRDAAPYFSNDTRQKMVKMASIGEFIIKMADNGNDFYANGEQNSKIDVKNFYTSMKKYIPINRRKNIDLMMNMFENINSKMKPKPASNGLESVINSLSRVNELSKIVSSAGNIKRLGVMLKNMQNEKGDISSVVETIGSILGKDNMQKLDNILSAFAK